uniref:Toxin TdNa2 n=1 Tax=Tityus discrepans TaxID=57059 RepID=SCNA2_TITDI
RDAYPADWRGCKPSCPWGSSSWCNEECTSLGGSSGYCAWPACWCYGLPDSVRYYNNKCHK